MADIYALSRKIAPEELDQLLYNSTLTPCEQTVVREDSTTDGNFEKLPENLREKFFKEIIRFQGIFSPDIQVKIKEKEKSFLFEFAPKGPIACEFLCGCGGIAPVAPPLEEKDGGISDSGVEPDSGVSSDASILSDGGTDANSDTHIDAGTQPDGGIQKDAGTNTNSGIDAGNDAGVVPDAGDGDVADASDASVEDAGAPDATTVDAGTEPDSGVPDADIDLDAGNDGDLDGSIDAGFSLSQPLQGIVTNFVGPPEGDQTAGISDDTTSGNGNLARFNQPTAICLTPDGKTGFVMDSRNFTIRKIDGIGTNFVSVSTFAGNPGQPGIADGMGANAQFGNHSFSQGPYGCDVDPIQGAFMLVVDTGSSNIRRVELQGSRMGLVTTVAGSTTGDSESVDGKGTDARFVSPEGIKLSKDGRKAYIADSSSQQIRVYDVNTQEVSTLVGGSGGLSNPQGVTIDSTDTNLYLTDSNNNLVRKIVVSTGAVTTLAGSGVDTSTDGTGTAAAFQDPVGIAIDPTDTNLYVSEVNPTSNRIRKIIIATKVVTTAAGSSTSLGDTNGTGIAATFNGPQLIVLDPTGSTLYIPDQNNNKIRQMQ